MDGESAGMSGTARSVPIDVLVPTYGRPGALAVTLTSLWAQT
jgi:hypothetical protein